MKEFSTTREAYEALLAGSASLEDVSDAASRTIGAYFERSGRSEKKPSSPEPKAKKR